ncbi:F-box associated domain-containing protein [Caenorhabditis elegans]|uniref:F-box associated domain-containing protein n=1 Tax=Caenorhabditis elegans TaxID=6239 RepID=U4PBN3_CAEEL|nr:F-box associated domain-containing protein [Caenorhabditis elegans]CDH93133.1 F-box associated domain-containing protein [Caenorhabditis elegans]|eukprot:NP_001294396.1 F-box B protein [Caenorhabditis elegans]
MDDYVPIPFTLLKLPQKSIDVVLRRMCIEALVELSFTSKAAMQQTKHLGIKTERFIIAINSNEILIDVSGCRDFRFYTFECSTPSHHTVQKPIRVHVGFRGERWETPFFGVRQFLNHLMEIFHQTKLDSLHISTADPECSNELKGMEFGWLSMMSMTSDNNSSQDEDALRQFSGKTDSICLNRNPFSIEPSKQMQMILTRNMNVVSTKCDLNDVFVTNARSFTAFLKIEDVNIFLKHWMHRSDRKLKSAWFDLDAFRWDVEDVLEPLFKGIAYHVAPADREFIVHLPKKLSGCGDYRVIGGYDVRRNDGMTATIIVADRANVFLKMFFWI